MTLEKTLSTHLLSEHADEAARILDGLPPDSVATVLTEAPAKAAAEVFARLAPYRAAAVLLRLDPSRTGEVVGELGFDATAHLVRLMDDGDREGFVDTLDPALAGPIRTLLEFPAGTAGSLMDSRVLALPLDVTAAEAIDHVRDSPDQVRYNLYVVDRDRRLVGVLNLRELMLAEPTDLLEAIARREVLSIAGHDDRSSVLDHPAWREAHSLPVVDRDGTYLGAIRYRTWRLLVDESSRGTRDGTTAEALGDLFSMGIAGVVGAVTQLSGGSTSGTGHESS